MSLAEAAFGRELRAAFPHQSGAARMRVWQPWRGCSRPKQATCSFTSNFETGEASNMEARTMSRRRAALQRRSAIGVCVGVACFFVAQAAYHYPFASWWPRLRDGEYSQKLVALRKEIAAKSADQPLIIAFGSSLTSLGLRPEALDSCRPSNPVGPLVYNFGMPGTTVIGQLMCLKRLLAEDIRPDWVMVEIYPPHFLLTPHA